MPTGGSETAKVTIEEGRGSVKKQLVSAGSIWLLWSPFLKSIVRNYCSFPNFVVVTLLYELLDLMHLL